MIGSRMVPNFVLLGLPSKGSVFAQRPSLHTPRAGHLLIYAICLTANMILSIQCYMVTCDGVTGSSECRLGLQGAGRL